MEVVTSQTIYPAFSWEVLLVVAIVLFIGVLLLAVELFLIPGFGVTGVLGLCALIGGSVAAWVWLGAAYGALVIVLTVAVTVGLVIVATRTKLVKRVLVLDTKLEHGGGTEAADMSALLDKEGITKTDLRPAGIALFGDERVDVVSEGGFIESGKPIRVVQIDGPRVIVAKQEVEN